MVSRKRSFTKSMTFRVLATLTTIALVWVFTGNMVLSLGLGFMDFVSKFVLYYFHERAWSKVEWGK